MNKTKTGNILTISAAISRFHCRADISYPTDLSLLNEAREKLEHIIDVLHAPHQGKLDKPRTYREKARKNYLAIAKQRWSSQKKIRKGIGQQLRYVARDLRVIQ